MRGIGVGSLLCCLALNSWGYLVEASTYRVTSFSELQSAVSNLEDGDIIELGSDIVFASTLSLRYVSNVSITSAEGQQYELDGDNEVRLFDVVGATVDFTNLKMVNGKGNALYAGGLQIRSSSKLSFDNIVFQGHQILDTTLAGGALTIEDSEVTFSSCTFDSNLVSGGAGGSAVRLESSEANFTSCDFTNNVASAGIGGALHLNRATSVVLREVNFIKNKQSQGYSAGAITIEASADAQESLQLIGCSFTGNEGSSNSHDIDSVWDYLLPDIFDILSACDVDFYDPDAEGELSCDFCETSYPATFSGTCNPCVYYSPFVGGWSCEPARCSSIADPLSFCAGTNYSGALVADADEVDCVGAPGPTCDEDVDVEICCAASCSSIEDVGSFCFGSDYGLGLVGAASTASCQSTECNATLDSPTCCLTTTTTVSTTTRTRTTTTATQTSTTATFTTSTITSSTSTLPNTTTTTTSTTTSTTITTRTLSSTTLTTSTTTRTTTTTEKTTETTTAANAEETTNYATTSGENDGPTTVTITTTTFTKGRQVATLDGAHRKESRLSACILAFVPFVLSVEAIW
mmetsp:Transcript_84476/g.185387  ORF Transcript_84476/g.185387 Transcript_84476/m.185387 type:complete len:576 (+) Transcript_84476:60-1787(+)